MVHRALDLVASGSLRVPWAIDTGGASADQRLLRVSK
jgi:hypothetical protein